MPLTTLTYIQVVNILASPGRTEHGSLTKTTCSFTAQGKSKWRFQGEWQDTWQDHLTKFWHLS